jgi:ATP-dependent protease HslVU (ClpYQ) peptidase subunit
MTSQEDAIALCGLSRSEVAAIAEHEHVPEAAAAVLGQYLLHQEQGLEKIQQMIIDDIRSALLAGNTAHAAGLLAALQHLLKTRQKDGREQKGCCRG